MRREPGRLRTRRLSRVPARGGLLLMLTGGLAVTGGLMLAACGSAPPATFRPVGVATPDRTAGLASPARPARGTAGPLEWPPFGRHVHIVMPGWLPADPGEAPAVIAAKNFLLAFLYAEYRGNQDDRWTGFASGAVVGALKANLSQPSVTTESFTGHYRVLAHAGLPGPRDGGRRGRV